MDYLRAEEFKETMANLLSKKRYQHCLNVADMGQKLGKIHGVNPEKCYIASLLHDIQREADIHQQYEYAQLSGFPLDYVETVSTPLFHAPAGAYFTEKFLHIDDREIISAIRFHTVGNESMSPIEKIVFVADVTSADRNYPDVDKIREMAVADLNTAVFEILRFTVGKVAENRNLLAEYTFKGYNYYRKKREVI